MASLQEITRTPAQPDRPEITDEEGAAMARAIVNLFARWELTDEQARTLLGSISLSTWARWKKGAIGNVPRDLKTRLSNLMGIHKALRIVFKDKERVYGWVKRENDAFGGSSALNVMMGGEITDLMRVRCQSALNWDPVSARKRDPLVVRFSRLRVWRGAVGGAANPQPQSVFDDRLRRVF